MADIGVLSRLLQDVETVSPYLVDAAYIDDPHVTVRKEHTHNGMALSFGGHLRRWGGPLERGAGLTQKNTGVRLRCLCVDLSACPPVQGRAGFRLRADVT